MTDPEKAQATAVPQPAGEHVPAEQFPSGADRSVATVDRHRVDIDRGRTGDKVAFPDPAAAPLGTDEEAAGNTAAPADPGPAIPDAPPGDAGSKTMSGEMRGRFPGGWMPIGFMLLGVSALAAAFIAWGSG